VLTQGKGSGASLSLFLYHIKMRSSIFRLDINSKAIDDLILGNAVRNNATHEARAKLQFLFNKAA
jgi:hypothetical protein